MRGTKDGNFEALTKYSWTVIPRHAMGIKKYWKMYRHLFLKFYWLFQGMFFSIRVNDSITTWCSRHFKKFVSLSSGYFFQIIPGSFSTSWEVYSSRQPVRRLSANQTQLPSLPSQVSIYTPGWREAIYGNFDLAQGHKVPQPAWLGFEPTFWRLSHQNLSLVR